jgi:hypothetical protein
MWEKSMADGKSGEQRFASILTSPVFATKEQDINEHWDVMDADGNRYDVKIMKRYRRSDPAPTDRLHYVELRNVLGKNGWLYGQADFIVFETRQWWLVVKRNDLVKFIEGAVWGETTETPQPYKLYQREGRQDLMTIVPTVDLLSLATKVVNK